MSTAEELRCDSRIAFWVFPQGRYERIPAFGAPQLEENAPLPKLHPGLLYFLRSVPGLSVSPVAIRYDFMRYRRPVAFVDIGKPIEFPEPFPKDRRKWREVAMSSLLTEIGVRHEELKKSAVLSPWEYTSLLRDTGTLIAGQHLELSDVARQLRGMPTNPMATVAHSNSRRKQMRINISSSVTVDEVRTYLHEKYHLSSELIGPFNEQCEIAST